MPTVDLPLHPNVAPRPASLNGLRVREDVLFTNAKGEDDKGMRKRVGKLLDGITDALQKMLAPDECVLYAARAQEPIGVLEQWGMGAYVYRVTITALVFTNQRLLRLALAPKGSFGNAVKFAGKVKTLAYGDIQAAKASGFLSGVLWLTYKSGKKEKYWGIRRADTKKMGVLFDVLLPAHAAASTAVGGMVSLCPDCLSPLSERVYHCARCGLVFKDEQTMLRRAWLIPGGGYFYCGQTLLGVLDLIAEGWLWLMLLFMALTAYATWGKPPRNPDALDPTGALITAVFLAIVLVFKKLLTIHHSRRFVREFISTGQKDPMRAQMAGAGSLR